MKRSLIAVGALVLLFQNCSSHIHELGLEGSGEALRFLSDQGTASFQTEAGVHGQGNAYAPHVAYHEGSYKMWYGGQGIDGKDRIHYATSSDGNVWKKHGVVFEIPAANHVNDPSVAIVGGTYFMYYTLAMTGIKDQIALATSGDGISWTNIGVVLGASSAGHWDSCIVGRPSVIHEGGVFKLFYDGSKDFALDFPFDDCPKVAQPSGRHVGLATSTDGRNFSRRASPVLMNAGAVDVSKLGSGYILLTEAVDGVYRVNSPDGLSWASPQMKIVNAPAGSYGMVTPHLFTHPLTGEYKLFYGNARRSSWDGNEISVVNNFSGASLGLLGSGAPESPVPQNPVPPTPAPAPAGPLQGAATPEFEPGWPAHHLIDQSPGSVYSSRFFPTAIPDRPCFLHAYFQDGSRQVSSVRLQARMANGIALGFPKAYDVYVTRPDNSGWELVAQTELQPDASGTVVISFSRRSSWGVLIQPRVLGADDYGSHYLQMAEIALQ